MIRAVLAAGSLILATVCVAASQLPSRSASGSTATDPVGLPERLADTGLYLADRPGVVDPAHRAFAPQYALWSDNLAKSRWISLPPGSAIDASDPLDWRFPIGTRFWKEFAQGGRKVETRFIWRASESRWMFASYVWNEEGTEAVLAPEEGVPGVIEVAPGRRHTIPSRTDCTACHGTERPTLGFNALQLSTDRDPYAIHGEPLEPGMLTLQTLVDEELLQPARTELVTSPPRIRTSSPVTRAVLGYMAANCGMCHNGTGEIAALGPVIRHRDLIEDGDAVARGLVLAPTRWRVPDAGEGASVLVHAGTPDLSAILVRMRSRSPSSQMPPLGTVLRDQQAIDLIARWITTELAAAQQ